jgi:hypothetical protein
MMVRLLSAWIAMALPALNEHSRLLSLVYLVRNIRASVFRSGPCWVNPVGRAYVSNASDSSPFVIPPRPLLAHFVRARADAAHAREPAQTARAKRASATPSVKIVDRCAPSRAHNDPLSSKTCPVLSAHACDGGDMTNVRAFTEAAH